MESGLYYPITKLLLTVPALVGQFPYVLCMVNVGEILSEENSEDC